MEVLWCGEHQHQKSGVNVHVVQRDKPQRTARAHRGYAHVTANTGLTRAALPRERSGRTTWDDVVATAGARGAAENACVC